MNNLVIPDSVDNAAKNLSDKPTRAIGQTFADLWQLTLGGRVSYAVEKQKLRYAHALEEYRKTLEEKVDAIPAEKQTEPSLQIAAQALEDSKYCIESEELREIFSNLISHAMHSDYANMILPSFSKIAQQLSPLDAQMLVIMKKWQAYGGIAIVNYSRTLPDGGSISLVEYVPAEWPESFPFDAASCSLVSLRRLGLINIPEDLHFISSKRYDVFKESPLYKELTKTEKQAGYQLDMKKLLGKLTILGERFVNVCLG